MTFKSVFFWKTGGFTPGLAQVNEGPFHVGTVSKFFRAQVRGQINYTGVTLAVTSNFDNALAWGLQQIPHGTAAADVITSADSDTWLMRRQSGSEDYLAAWAPSTSSGAVVLVNEVADDWAGQLAIGADTDVYLSFKTSDSGFALPELTTYGTIRLWWG